MAGSGGPWGGGGGNQDDDGRGDGRDGACGCGESEIAKHANDDADIFVIAVMRASASLAPYSLDAVLMAGTVPVCFN